MLTHWLKSETVDHALYWVAQPSAPADQLRQFSQALYQFENPTGTQLDTFSYQSWEQALEQVARLAETKRLTLIIDEFTYLLARTPELAGLFQNIWDHLLRERNLLLILCGSHLGMMQRHILSYQAPLYGRASAQFQQGYSARYTLKMSQLRIPTTPETWYVFVNRLQGEWRSFLVIPRQDLLDLHDLYDIGSVNKNEVLSLYNLIHS